jgi:hypothetical protein
MITSSSFDTTIVMPNLEVLLTVQPSKCSEELGPGVTTAPCGWAAILPGGRGALGHVSLDVAPSA